MAAASSGVASAARLILSRRLPRRQINYFVGGFGASWSLGPTVKSRIGFSFHGSLSCAIHKTISLLLLHLSPGSPSFGPTSHVSRSVPGSSSCGPTPRNAIAGFLSLLKKLINLAIRIRIGRANIAIVHGLSPFFLIWTANLTKRSPDRGSLARLSLWIWISRAGSNFFNLHSVHLSVYYLPARYNYINRIIPTTLCLSMSDTVATIYLYRRILCKKLKRF